MRTFSSVRRLQFITLLFAGMSVVQGATAATVQPKAGHVRYTTGTADARTDHTAQETDASATRPAGRVAGQWQVASVDASVVARQFSPVSIQPAAFESSSVETTSALRAPLSASGSSRERAPGFWATSLSTLALAIFFFLRRLG